MKRVLAVGFMLIGSICYAQEQAGTRKVLTFDEAIKIALRNGVLFNQQKNNLELNQFQKTQNISAIGPNVTLNGSAFRNDGNFLNTNTGQVINGITDRVSGSINANLNLFSGFSRINSIKQYSSLVDAQAFYVNRTQQDLINTVGTQYLQVMLDVELERIAKENFEAVDKLYKQIKEQVDLGAKSPVDQYNQEALTKAAELRYVQATITKQNDKVLLTQTLLIDPLEDYEVEKPKWDVNTIGYDVLSIEKLTDQAKLSRADYLRAMKTENAYRFSTAAAKGGMMPSLYAFGTYGSAYNYQHAVPDSVHTYSTIVATDPTAASGYSLKTVESANLVSNPEKPRPFSEQFRSNNVFKQYGFQLTIPLFNGLQNRGVYLQQKVLYENAKLTTKNLEYQIKNDVIRAVNTFEGAKKAYSVTTDQLRAADLALQFETERYNLGVTSFVDYANANKTFVQAQTDKAQAEYRLLFQKVLVDYAVGTLKPEDFQQ
jgi:outer membrane protein